MMVFHLSTSRGLLVLAALLAATANIGDALQWTETYIPYNSDDLDSFGANFAGKPPYNMNDPLRQHLHVYQQPSDTPSPVAFISHSNGSRAVTTSGWDVVASAGFSVISWESITTIKPQDGNTCLDDFDLVWSWFQANAEKYNFDTNNVIMTGRSRGTICQWPVSVSGKPEIKGLFYINALPDPAWNPAAKQGSGYVWDMAVNPNSPPALLLFTPECPKPITQDCVAMPNPSDWHNPRHGQAIVDKYNENGIGSKIHLIDGLGSNLVEPWSFFPAFLDALSTGSMSAISIEDGSPMAAGASAGTSLQNPGGSPSSASRSLQCSPCRNGKMTNPDGVISLNSMSAQCGDLEQNQKALSEDQCNKLQVVAAQPCGCTDANGGMGTNGGNGGMGANGGNGGMGANGGNGGMGANGGNGGMGAKQNQGMNGGNGGNGAKQNQGMNGGNGAKQNQGMNGGNGGKQNQGNNGGNGGNGGQDQAADVGPCDICNGGVMNSLTSTFNVPDGALKGISGDMSCGKVAASPKPVPGSVCQKLQSFAHDPCGCTSPSSDSAASTNKNSGSSGSTNKKNPTSPAKKPKKPPVTHTATGPGANKKVNDPGAAGRSKEGSDTAEEGVAATESKSFLEGVESSDNEGYYVFAFLTVGVAACISVFVYDEYFKPKESSETKDMLNGGDLELNKSSYKDEVDEESNEDSDDELDDDDLNDNSFKDEEEVKVDLLA